MHKFSVIHNYVEATPYGVLALDSFSNNRRRRREMMSTVNGRPRIVLRTQRRTVYLLKARADDRCEAGTDPTRRFGKILGCVRGKRFKTKKGYSRSMQRARSCKNATPFSCRGVGSREFTLNTRTVHYQLSFPCVFHV